MSGHGGFNTLDNRCAFEINMTLGAASDCKAIGSDCKAIGSEMCDHAYVSGPPTISTLKTLRFAYFVYDDNNKFQFSKKLFSCLKFLACLETVGYGFFFRQCDSRNCFLVKWIWNEDYNI